MAMIWAQLMHLHLDYTLARSEGKYCLMSGRVTSHGCQTNSTSTGLFAYITNISAPQHKASLTTKNKLMAWQKKRKEPEPLPEQETVCIQLRPSVQLTIEFTASRAA